jgi:hypothetical protein
MVVPQLRCHLRTNNVYVKRQLIRDNISQLKNLMAHPDFSKLIYQHRLGFKTALQRQESILASLNKIIVVKEQTTLPFGAIPLSK